MAPLSILALDIGTSSIRASIYDGRLRSRRSAQVHYRWRLAPGGVTEADAGRLLARVAEAIDEVLQNERRSIDAVCIAAFWHSLLGVDAAWRPLTPVLPWSDMRAADEAAALRQRARERPVHARTGCRFHPSYWPARLAWFRQHQPRIFDRVRRWVSFGEFLEQRWGGRTAVSVSQASGTGLFNQDACGWDRETVAISGVDPASLAPVAGLDDTGFELSPRLRRRWPRLAGARWLPAIGDGAANNAGAGCVTRGRAAVMIGTSGALRVLWAPGPAERVRQPFGLWRYRLDAHRILVGGALSNGGNVRDWMVRTLAADRRLQPRAEALEPDAHGLTVLPFLSGTRSPDYLTHATGTISGLTLATRPEHVLRASMEAVAYRFAGILEGLSDTVRVDEVVASGGALDRSVAWTQMLADVLNRPILLSPDKELTSRGAAAVGLDVLGIAPLEDLGPSISRRLRPHARRHDVYRAAMLRQRELMRRVYGRTKLSSG